MCNIKIEGYITYVYINEQGTHTQTTTSPLEINPSQD